MFKTIILQPSLKSICIRSQSFSREGRRNQGRLQKRVELCINASLYMSESIGIIGEVTICFQALVWGNNFN